MNAQYGQKYEVDVTLRFDVTNGEAVRRIAWKLAALEANHDSGVDVVADHLAATTEGALSVIVASESWGMALRQLAEKVEGLTFTSASAGPQDARRINEEKRTKTSSPLGASAQTQKITTHDRLPRPWSPMCPIGRLQGRLGGLVRCQREGIGWGDRPTGPPGAMVTLKSPPPLHSPGRSPQPAPIRLGRVG